MDPLYVGVGFIASGASPRGLVGDFMAAAQDENSPSINLPPAASIVGAGEVREIAPGKRVRISAPTLTADRLVGTVASVDISGLWLLPQKKNGSVYLPEGLEGRVQHERGALQVPWAAMQQLELGQKKWSGKRTAIGAAIGMLVGAATGALIGLAADDPSSDLSGYGVVVGPVVFGGIGLVLGTIIGALPDEQWQKISLGRPLE